MESSEMMSECKLVLILGGRAKKIEDFRSEYNNFLPHSSIIDLTPKEFIILHENSPETPTSAF
jgi:putative transposase